MIYKSLLKKIAHFQVEHPYLTISIILVLTLFFYIGSAKVRTVASLENMMPSNIEEIKSFNELRDNNIGQDLIAIVLELNRESSNPNNIQDITDKQIIDYIRNVKKLIQTNPDIGTVYALSDLIPEQYTYQQLKDKLPESAVKQFVNDDHTTTIIMATTDVSANDPRMIMLSEKIKKDINSLGTPEGIIIKYTGTPIIQQKLGELISIDRTKTQNISTILVFIITMILFGTFTSALVPIIIVTISVNWLYGLMGYFNLPISTLAGGVAAMVIGIGIDYAIHLMNKFKNERQSGKSIKESVETAIQETGVALTGASIATTVAFLAFLFGSMPEMNRFGLLMATGVTSSFLLSIFGLPSLLIIEEKLIHCFSKRFSFGIEGDLMLYHKNEIHPDEFEVINPDIDELKTLSKKYKICRKK